MDDHTTPLRCCTKCGNLYPATLEYFRKESRRRSGLSPQCKQCLKNYFAAYYQEHRDKFQGYGRKYSQKPQVIARRRVRQQTSEYKAYQQEYHKRADYKARFRQYLQRPEIRERERKRKQSSDYKTKERSRRRAPAYRTRERELARRPIARLKDAVKRQRRYARKRALPETLTPVQWQRALDYFNGCCAVCGRQLRDLFGTHTVAIEHWIPLASPNCPGTTALNCLPLCHGEGGCNNSKNAKLPEEWLIARYGKRRGIQILKRVETYFAWVREQDETTTVRG